MKNKIFIAFRNDDLCALSDPIKERKILEVFKKHGVPQVICTIPSVTEDPHNCHLKIFHPINENTEITSLLREYNEDGLIEIAQHGYTHQTNKHHPSCEEAYTLSDFMQGIDRRWLPYKPAKPQGYSEFNGLSYEEIKNNISDGHRLLEDVLDVKIGTFAFPWDSLDQRSLDVLMDDGFKNVLSGDNVHRSKSLNLVTNCYADIFSSLDFIEEMKREKSPVLAHIEYHSWMLSEEDIEKIDSILGQLSNDKYVQFIKVSEIASVFPRFKNIRNLKRCLDARIDRVNLYLGTKRDSKKYFVFNRFYYLFSIAKMWALGFLVGTVGYKKAAVITGAVLAAFIFFKSMAGSYGVFDAVMLTALSSMFLFTLFLNFKGMLHVSRAKH